MYRYLTSPPGNGAEPNREIRKQSEKATFQSITCTRLCAPLVHAPFQCFPFAMSSVWYYPAFAKVLVMCCAWQSPCILSRETWNTTIVYISWYRLDEWFSVCFRGFLLSGKLGVIHVRDHAAHWNYRMWREIIIRKLIHFMRRILDGLEA